MKRDLPAELVADTAITAGDDDRLAREVNRLVARRCGRAET